MLVHVTQKDDKEQTHYYKVGQNSDEFQNVHRIENPGPAQHPELTLSKNAGLTKDWCLLTTTTFGSNHFTTVCPLAYDLSTIVHWLTNLHGHGQCPFPCEAYEFCCVFGVGFIMYVFVVVLFVVSTCQDERLRQGCIVVMLRLFEFRRVGCLGTCGCTLLCLVES